LVDDHLNTILATSIIPTLLIPQELVTKLCELLSWKRFGQHVSHHELSGHMCNYELFLLDIVFQEEHFVVQMFKSPSRFAPVANHLDRRGVVLSEIDRFDVKSTREKIVPSSQDVSS
jgi:hypothetical protein